MDKKKKGRDVMTVYQELQLSCAGSKNLIRRTENKEEKKRHILIYNVKVYLVVAYWIIPMMRFIESISIQIRDILSLIESVYQ